MKSLLLWGGLSGGVLLSAVVASQFGAQQQNSAKCNFQTAGWLYPEAGRPAFGTIIFIGIKNNEILWNDEIITEEELKNLIEQGNKLAPQPLLVFTAKNIGASCAFSAHIQQAINRYARCDETTRCAFGSKNDWQKLAPQNRDAVDQ